MDDEKKSRQQLLEELIELRRQAAGGGQVERQPSASEARYELLVKNVRADLAVIDYDGKFIYVNEISAAQFGLKPDEIIGRNQEEFFPQEINERQLSNIRRVIETGEAYHEEARTFINEQWRWYDVSLQPYVDSHGKISAAMLLAYDITASKNAEQALRESEEKYRELVEKGGIAILIDNKEGYFTYFNNKLCQLFGYSKEEMEKQSIMSLIHPDDYERVLKYHQDRFDGLDSKTRYEFKGVRKDGSFIYLEIDVTLLKSDGVVVGTRSYIWDITERRRAEETLRRNEQFNSAVIENSPLGISVRNSQGRLLSYNEAWKKLWDISDDEIGKLYFSPRAALKLDEHDEYLGKWKPLVERIYQKGGYLFIPEVKSTRHRSGNPRWISQYFYAIKDESGRVDRVIVLTEDITDRKKAEEALRQSEKQFRELTDLLPQTVFEVDLEGRVTFANRSGFESTGYTQEDIDFGLTVAQLIVPEDRERVTKNIATRLVGDDPRDHEYTMLRKDGSTFPVLIYSTKIVRDEKTVGLRGIAVDITLRKEAEIEIKKHRDHLEELVRERSSELIATNEMLRAEIVERKKIEKEVRESGERYRVLFETAGEGILIADFETRKFRYANPAICRFLGYSAEELVGMGVNDIHPKDKLREIHAEFELNSTSPQHIAENIPCLTKNGNLIYADIVGATIYIDGIRCSVGFFRDISERIQAREALRESEEKFRLLAELSPNAISIVREGKIVFMNEAGLKLYGADQPKDILGKESLDFIHPEYRDFIREKRRQVVEENKSSGFKEEKLVRLDGRVVILEAASAPFTYEGQSAIQVVVRDITERKRIEEALKDSELQYRTTIDSMGDSIHVINQNYKIILCNKALREWHDEIGLNSDIHGKDLFDVYPFLSEKVREEYRRVFETGETLVTVESNEVGSKKIVTETRKIPISDGNQVVRVVTVLRDITKRVLAEEALRESEARLRSTVESLPFDFFALDENGRYILQNSVCRMHWGDLIGTNPEEAEVRDEVKQIWHENNRRALAGETVEGEVEYLFSGQVEHYYKIIAPIYYQGRIKGILGLNMDITDRRRAEDELRKATEELSIEREALESKNTALKEVLNQIETEKRNIKLQIAANIDRVIIPAIQRLRENCGDRLRKHVDNLESSLKTISAPYIEKLRKDYSQLSPRELEICDMIKKGLMSKDISELLNVSVLTVHKHREMIRKKLGIKNKEVNLSSFLQSL
ncbi:MAG: hypothetical protein CVT49_03825 [candidate division Zixibacteria bacterium HGW-Zixibacteria-1]|nr:MAG: hypothetical protein CVT49_03825 [candidate division Zixibacteria bacterium HGW-Zixibacteria-1]